MITETPFNANLAVLESGEGYYSTALNGIENYRYSDERSFGFSIEETCGQKISGYLVEKTPVKRQTFDEHSQQIVDREIEQTTLIPFQLDFDLGLLSIFSDQSDTSKLISRIGEASGWEFSMTESQLSIKRIYDNIQNTNWGIDVSSIRITNFQAEDGLSGTYTVKEVGDVRLQEILDSHSSNITIIRASIQTDSQEATFGFFQSGTIRLYSSLESANPLWNDVKQIVRETY